MVRIGIDIGGTKINVGLFEEESKRLLASKKAYITDITDLSAYIQKEAGALCAENGLEPSALLSVGIGIPGTVSADGKRIIKAPNIQLLSNDIAPELEKALGVPVRFVQDSRAAAWGEYLCGGGKGAESVVCVTLGTGIGTGIVLNGKIYYYTASGFDLPLPEGYTLAGEILSVDHIHPPAENFHGGRVEAGQKVYRGLLQRQK